MGGASKILAAGSIALMPIAVAPAWPDAVAGLKCLPASPCVSAIFGVSIALSDAWLAIGDPVADRVILDPPNAANIVVRRADIVPPPTTSAAIAGRGFGQTVTIQTKICKVKNMATRIFDESGITLSGTTLDTLQESPFKAYVAAVSQHVTSKLEMAKPCRSRSDTAYRVMLTFVYRPLVETGVRPSWAFNRPRSENVTRLHSPWVQSDIGGSGDQYINVIFIWSERQILLDQAILSVDRSDQGNATDRIDKRGLDAMIEDYTQSILLETSSDPDVRDLVSEAIEKRIPQDVFWLFRRAWQSTLAPFSVEVHYALDITMQSALEGYIYLSDLLFDISLESKNREINYDDIRELEPKLDMSRYKLPDLR